MEAEVQPSDWPKSAGEQKQTTQANLDGDSFHKSTLIKDGLEKNISEDSKKKIYEILNNINKLSDVEKLLLYLKLPTGVPAQGPSSSSETHSGYHRVEHQTAIRWLRTHLEEDTGTCVQKEELYSQYCEHCSALGYKSVNQFDFGKLLRHLFPNLKLRHLGQRGQSKTCYGGLKNCSQLKPLEVPSLDITEESNQPIPRCEEEDNITQCATELVCEWAQKLHENRQFSGLQDLAEHLITNCVVSTNSTAAFTIIAAAQKEDRKIFSGPQATTSSKSSNSDGSTVKPASHLQAKTHLQLQRTLRGRQMLREQRERMGGDHSSEPRTPKACSSSSASSSPQEGRLLVDIPKPAEPKDNKSTSALKKTTTLTPQKQILPKSTIVQQVVNQGSSNVLFSGQQTLGLGLTGSQVLVSNGVAGSITAPKAVPQPVFVLPSQVLKSVPQEQGASSAPIIKTAPMVLLSPVNDNSKMGLAVQKDKVVSSTSSTLQRSQNKVSTQSESLDNKVVQAISTVANKHPGVSSQLAGRVKLPTASDSQINQPATTTSQQITTTVSKSKNTSKLAMLLTETPSESCERRFLEKGLKHKDVLRFPSALKNNQNCSETVLPLRHLPHSELNQNQRPAGLIRSISQDSGRPVDGTSDEMPRPRQLRAVSTDSRSLNSSPLLNQLNMTSMAGQMGTSVDISGVQSTLQSTASGSCFPSSETAITKSGRGKKKQVKISTPAKSRQSSKTVSTLLKETRGYGPQTDIKGFVKDRRPVAQLLKESRSRKMSCDSPRSSPVIGSVPVPANVVNQSMMSQNSIERMVSSSDVHTSRPSLSRQQSLHMPQQSLDVAHSRAAPALPTHTSVRSLVQGYSTAQNGEVSLSGSTQLPSQNHSQLLKQSTTNGKQIQAQKLAISGKDPFTCFGKEPVMPGSAMLLSDSTDDSLNYMEESAVRTDQDSNNNGGLHTKTSHVYHSDESNELQNDLDKMVNTVNSEFGQTSSGVGMNSAAGMAESSKDQVSDDALSSYVRGELSSDLADITPSISLDSQHSMGRDTFTGNAADLSGLLQSEDLNSVQGNLERRGLIAEDRNPFMSVPVTQQNMSFINMQHPVDEGVTQRFQSQRPSSELQETGGIPQDVTINRPSTLPPDLSGALQNCLLNSQQSLCINDQNSCDSLSGYSTRQTTPCSQMLPTRSPSFNSVGSTPSTPSSLMSPPERYHLNKASSEPTNSFMPIQGSSGAVPLDQVSSPIRPMVTLARKQMHGNVNTQNNMNFNAGVGQMGNFPRFAGPSANNNKSSYESSFVPYGTSDAPGSNPQQRQDIQQRNTNFQQPQPQTAVNNTFLPASSIRPVKRPLAGAQSGGRKRVRHRSAQDANSLAKAQAKQNHQNQRQEILSNLLKSGLGPPMALQQSLSNIGLSQRPINLPKPLVTEQANLSNPQSPFSPEMQDIMIGEQQKSVDSQESQEINAAIYRSQSVPAQSIQRAGSETCDVVATGLTWEQNKPVQEYIGESQPKAQVQNQRAPGTVQYSEYNARRNITSLLQDEHSGSAGNWGYTEGGNPNYRIAVRGDHMISGASVTTSQYQALMNNPTLQMALAQKIKLPYTGDAVPTPPSSQNPTPDFSAELSTIADPSGGFGMGRAAASTVMDTPNSLDPLTTGDSQESLKDDNLLSDIYKGNPDMMICAGVAQGQMWVTNSGREVCPQWNQS